MSLYVLGELKIYLAVLVGQVTTLAAFSWRRIHTSGPFPGRWSPGEKLEKGTLLLPCKMRGNNLLPKQLCLAVSGLSTLLSNSAFFGCIFVLFLACLLTPVSPPSNLPYGPQRPSHPGTCSQGRPGIFKKKIPSAGHGDQTFRRSHDRTF